MCGWEFAYWVATENTSNLVRRTKALKYMKNKTNF